MDRIIHSVLYASRWLLAPIYLGLIGALLCILINFFVDLYSLLMNIFSYEEHTLVVHILGLIDLTLVGGLALMVMLSGFENFIAKTTREDENKLGWLGKLDTNSLKLKVAASIVAISSIHLLKIFMSMSTNNISNTKALVFLALHLTFVASACLMVLSDRKSKQSNNAKKLKVNV
jgi:uncharacterized protein (TIGR00645 family)